MREAVVGALAVLMALSLVACEPETIDVPPREEGQVLLDRAGILQESRVEDRLAGLPDEIDVVAVTFEAADVTAGDLDRAGEEVVDAWGVDVVVAAAAEPGHFHSGDAGERRRVFGLHAPDRFGVPRGLRERLVEEIVPPHAADNDWQGAFLAAVDELERQLAASEDGADEG